MAYHLIRKYRIDIFILMSFIVHILFGYISGFLSVTKSLPQKMNPIKVSFLTEKKPARKPDFKGQILETPKPKKQEKPLSRQVLSQHNSRMHSNIGKRGAEYRDNKTVIPMSKPKSSPPPSPAKKKKSARKNKPMREETSRKKLEKTLKSKEIIKKVGKFKKREGKKSAFSESLIRKKYKESNRKTPSTSTSENNDKKSLFMKTPLLDGTDLAKYARLDTGAKKEEEPASDSDTISLDTQEFKYVSYFTQIKRKIELVWSYPPEAGKRGLFGKLTLKFTILKDGTLANLSLLDSAGHQILDDEALHAVQMASPYPPFPKRIDKKKLNIIASFSYYPSFSLVQ